MSICEAVPYLLKHTSFHILRDTLYGKVAYRLLLSSLVHSRLLALAQDLKQAACQGCVSPRQP